MADAGAMTMKKVTLSNWANIAEIVGAIAVTLSLVFVGIQIRDNTRATQAATLQESVSYDIALLTSMASDPTTADTLNKYFFVAPRQLTEAEMAQGMFAFAAVLRHWENLYFQWLSGTLSDEAWQSRVPAVQQLLQSPGYEAFKDSTLAQAFDRGFIDYVMSLNYTANTQ
jgi:hypothetical protein